MQLGVMNLKSNKSILVILIVLLLVAAVLMPVQIRPAAYNQKESSSQIDESKKSTRQKNNADAGGFSILEQDDEKPGNYQPVTGKRVGPENHLLSMFVVFHKALDETLFEDLQLPDAMPDTEREPDAKRISEGSLLDVILGGNKGVTFFATNEDIPKVYNASNPLFMHRVVEEWNTKGYKQVTGEHYRSVFNEFGAMASIYYSDYTFRSWDPPTKFQTVEFFLARNVRKGVMLKQGADDAFIGILQYDMKLNDKVMRKIKRRIMRTRKSGPPAVASEVRSAYRSRSRWSGNALYQVNGNNNNNNANGDLRVVQHERAVKLSKMHNNNNKNSGSNNLFASPDNILASPAIAPGSKCCVFYSISYPMKELLDPDDPFTKKLFELYNMHFFKRYTYDDLRKFAILDAFVIPFSEFNRFVPFVENLMRNGIRDGAVSNRKVRAEYLKKLEQALALFLGLLGNEGYEYVMTPLRHEPQNRQ